MRNFTGWLMQILNGAGIADGGGVFYNGTQITSRGAPHSEDVRFPVYVYFDPSRVVPTGPDNAPSSVSVAVYITY
jgi:hypothetical protein